MSVTVQQPFKLFTDLDGNPLDNGYIYIGTYGANPETNPISIYWDAAMTIPASQPLRTTSGFITRFGSPANVYVAGDFSITIKSQSSALIYSALSWSFNNDIAFAINTATNKVTPVNADQFGLWDSVSGILNHVTWDNIKATLVTYLSALTSTWAISTTGNAQSSTTVTVNDAASDTTTWPLLAGSVTGVQTPLTDPGLTYDASINTLTTTTFNGNVIATTGTFAGTITRTSGAGVGISSISTDSGGIYGQTGVNTAYAIQGYNSSASASAIGIYGSTAGAGIGVYGNAGAGTGVYGYSANSLGVKGTTIGTDSYTVATLPVASAALAGARAYVIDANSAVFNNSAVGGGANKMPVFCNGAGWFIG